MATGVVERVSRAYALLGFVRMLCGYYMIIVTRASRCAQIGYHYVYKVDETQVKMHS